MEEFSTEHPLQKRDENLLLGSKDPHLSRVFGDGPNTPGVPAADVTNQAVMDESGQYHDDHGQEPEYRLFEEQPYVSDMSPTNLGLTGSAGNSMELSSSHKIAERKVLARGKSPANGKALFCMVRNCSNKPFADIRELQKHIASLHTNSMVDVETILRERGITIDAGTASDHSMQQNFISAKVVNNPADYQQSSASVIPQYNGPAHNQTSSSVHINANQNSEVLNSVAEAAFSQQPQEGTNQYNMLLLAQHAVQNHPVQLNQSSTQQTNPIQQNEYLQHQSSMALQEIAMSVNLRSSQCSNVQDAMSSTSNHMIRDCSKVGLQRQFISNPAQITGVRAQLRKSLSSNGKLENINASTREWNRLQIPVGRSLDSSTCAVNFLSMRMQQESDPTNIDNAPILKNLLADSKPERRMTSSENLPFSRENGHIATANYAEGIHNNWQNDHPSQQNSLRSPLLEAKRNEFQYCVNMNDQQQSNPNPSPLHSPNYTNNPSFTLPQPQSHHNTPLPQNDEQQFFAADNIIVNNTNGQTMDQDDKAAEDLNEMIIESENLVQDLIDAEANSNQSQQILPYRDQQTSMDGPPRLTPPPAYNIEPGVSVIQTDRSVQMYMAQNQTVKSEPQSPMIMSPMAQRSFFGGNAMPVHSNNMPLTSPTTPHQVPMHPPTPVGDANWQFPMSGQTQNYGSVPQSPVTPGPVNPLNMSQPTGQDHIVQNVNYLPQAAPQTAPSKGRTRRTSGGPARKNPDGTLSCSICGHSFRSVPALNGHMRVHSSSTDRKNKDERHRKASGNSSGGNESRTSHSLSSPTTSTFHNKGNLPISMYQNSAAYNSVTLPGYNNPSALYSPALSTMNATGAVVPITQNVNSRDASLVHRLNPQTAIYPYPLQHTGQMQPHDALIAAANLLARSEPEHFLRGSASNHDEYIRSGSLQPMADIQQLLAQQHAAGQGAHGFHGATSSGVILVSQPNLPGHSYMAGQNEPLAGSNATMPFVTTVPLAPSGAGAASRQSYSSSPPQDQNASSSQVDNIQFLQQTLIQQASNRSTPLADFADIAVLHDQGQLFTSNSMLGAPLNLQNQQSQQQEDGTHSVQQQSSEQIRMQEASSEAGLLSSVSDDLLWQANSQQAPMQKMTRGANAAMKGENILGSNMSQIHKSRNEMSQPPTDPFIFPVSIPVDCSREDATTTLRNYFRQDPTEMLANSSTSFNDDPIVKESKNAANPGTILPNSMMGGNPSGFRSLIRQRHFSEGSVLKKTFQNADMSYKQEAAPPDSDFVHTQTNVDFAKVTQPPGSVQEAAPTSPKRKADETEENGDIKRTKTELTPQNIKVENWPVPKHAAPARQRHRHRRYSADSQPQFKLPKPGRSPNFNLLYKPARGRVTNSGSCDAREKRRPPPLIIPPSVNAYSSGLVYISQLHHRRRPSGDSVSSCGNEKIPPYTPPPMLSPHRLGPGLFYHTPSTPSAKTTYRQGSGEHCPIPPIPEEEDDDDLVRSADPKINIGDNYQADAPKLCPKWKIQHDVHKARPIWKPTAVFESEKSTQSRHVEEYLKLSCSAAVPFGGCNKEYALHLLNENKGDILASTRQLLNPNVTVPTGHWMASYNYLGSSKWSQKERQMFERAKEQFSKDFYQISKAIGTKSTAECVDFYYHTVKRRRRRTQRPKRYREDEEMRVTFIPSPNGNEAGEKRDFLQDYALCAAAATTQGVREQQVAIEENRKTSEVLRRSPQQTAFIRAPIQIGLIDTSMQQASAHTPHGYTTAQEIPQIHSYARQPVNFPHPPIRHTVPIPSTRDYVPPHQRLPTFPCKAQNCGLSFQSVEELYQHNSQHTLLKPFLDRVSQASPSPASSPASVASAETEQPPKMYPCPRCGKVFAKVKSRNAHMKTHGKLATEKRRLKEEEQRKKLEEAARWRNTPGIMHPNPREQLLQYRHVPSPQTNPSRM